MRILAIDDDPTILEIIELFLESLGYSDIHVAPSAEQAIRLMSRSDAPFDLVLLDINMPGMSGISLIREIMHHPLHRHARIVMLSALDDPHHIEDAFIAGAVDYRVKPFELCDLEASIKAVERACQSDIEPGIRSGNDLRSGVTGMVPPEAIANCIQRIPPASRARATLAFVEIPSRPDPTAEAEYVVALAQELLCALEGRRSLLSHIGSRRFAIMSFGASDTSAPDLEALVNAAVAATDTATTGKTTGPTGFDFERLEIKARGGADLLAAFEKRRG